MIVIDNKDKITVTAIQELEEALKHHPVKDLNIALEPHSFEENIYYGMLTNLLNRNAGGE